MKKISRTNRRIRHKIAKKKTARREKRKNPPKKESSSIDDTTGAAKYDDESRKEALNAFLKQAEVGKKHRVLWAVVNAAKVPPEQIDRSYLSFDGKYELVKLQKQTVAENINGIVATIRRCDEAKLEIAFNFSFKTKTMDLFQKVYEISDYLDNLIKEKNFKEIGIFYQARADKFLNYLNK